MRLLAYCLWASALLLSPMIVAEQGGIRTLAARPDPNDNNRQRFLADDSKSKTGSSSSSDGGFQVASDDDIQIEGRFPCEFCGEGNDSKLTDGTISACFSANMKVQLEGVKEPVAMKDLQIGDRILTDNSSNGDDGVYETVYAFGHHQPSRKATFWKFHTSTTSQQQIMPFLEMTGEHLVFLQGKSNPVRASFVKVGDTLQTTNNNGDDADAALVQKIEMVERQGLYAPLTASGTLVVAGVKASSYIDILGDNNKQQSSLSTATFTTNAESVVFLRGEDVEEVPIMSHEQFVHLMLAPYRLMCRTVTSCEPSSSNNKEDGMPHYISFGIWLSRWATEQHIVVQALLLLTVAILASLILLIEMAMLDNKSTWSMIFAALVLTKLWIAMKKYQLVVVGRKSKTG